MENQLTMGIDVAKATLEVALWAREPDGQRGQGERLGTFANTSAGWEALRAALLRRRAGTSPLVDVVVEPTGGYELGVALWARAQPGWLVHRPNPASVRAWAKSEGLRAKTDRQDALLLARYGAAHPTLPLWQPLPSEVSELEQLLHRRDEVAEWLRRERVRDQQHAARPDASPAVRASRQRQIQALEEELAALEAAIQAHLRAHADLHARQTSVQSVSGIGPRVGTPLLVAYERFQTLVGRPGTLPDAQRVVAYLGLDPQPHESGTSVRNPALISRQGDRALRARLFMGALGALRGHNPVRDFYDRLVARGKPKKVALVAAARKMVVWSWAVFVSGQPFDPTKCTHTTA